MIIQEVLEQMFIEKNLENILTGLMTGLITSLVFLLALSRLKPRIKICDKISIEKDDDGTFYGFKVINKSWFFKVYDIKVKLNSMELLPSENNDDYFCRELKLRKEEHWFLNKINLKHLFQNQIHKEKRLNSRTDYAVQFFTKEDVKSLVESKQTIRFEVLAKHSLSGFSVIRNYDFKHKNDILCGSFLSGNTSKIKE